MPHHPPRLRLRCSSVHLRRALFLSTALLLAIVLAEGAPAATKGPPKTVTTTPVTGSTLRGKVVWRAAVQRATPRQKRRYGARPARVEFLVDGVVLAVDRSRPYGYRWNTLRETDGRHVLVVRAVWRQTLRRSAEVSTATRTLAAAPRTSDSTTVQVKNGKGKDRVPPSVPQNLRLTAAGQNSVSLAWDGSTDNTIVLGYGLYRNGSLLTKTSLTSHSFSGLACGTSHTLGVDAYDRAGNRSAMTWITAETEPCSPPAPTTTPSLSGTPQEGLTLTTSNGAWSGSPTGYAYQWLRCDSAGGSCVEVAGATAKSYALTAGDVGRSMRARVNASNAWGSAEATSDASATVVEPSPMPPPPPTAPSGALTWAPPVLSDPITLEITRPGTYNLQAGRDYRIKLGWVQGDDGHTGGVVLIGAARHVVMIGGRISPSEPRTSSEWRKGRALMFRHMTGIVHLEGLWLDRPSEGINIDAPNATFQIQNVRVTNMHTYQHNTSISHPDFIHTWNGPKEMRIDRFTGESDYQGFLWAKDWSVTNSVFPGRVTIKNTNMRPSPCQVGYCVGSNKDKPRFNTANWPVGRSTVFSYENFYVLTGWYSDSYRKKLNDVTGGWDNYNPVTNPNPSPRYTQPPYTHRGYDGRTYSGPPDPSSSDNLGRRPEDRMTWPTVSQIDGEIRWGNPPDGDYVPHGLPGTTYTTPGYQ